MHERTGLWRGITAVGALLLAVAIMAGTIMETYRTSLDAFVGTRSQRTVTDQSADSGDSWTYKSEYKTAKEAYEGFKKTAMDEAQETYALLKNSDNALPLSKSAKITMFGVRSYAPVYGSSGGSVTDGNSTVEITKAFEEEGFQINPSMLKAYQNYFKDKKWTTPQFGGGILPEYEDITKYNDPCELSLDELAKLNPEYKSQYGEYQDAAIVVVGRPAGENGDGYYPGQDGLADGVNTVTGNILSLSDEEMALVNEAKANFSKVIVLVNSTNPMEIANLQDDPDIDAIMWIGYPGAYGFYGVADVLNGTVSPSAHLGDVMAKNSAVAPAMSNYGNVAWKNASDFSEDAAVNSYLMEAEGIYTGYRYYETRYADIVMGNGGDTASAGTYAASDGTVATADGTWDYANEVVYPFGYNVTDFTSVSPHAAPKESVLAGTSAFCGFGNQGVKYWDAATLSKDRDMLLAIKQNMHYSLWAIANSNAMNGVNSSTHTENVMTWWRAVYLGVIAASGVVTLIGLAGYTTTRIRPARNAANGPTAASK